MQHGDFEWTFNNAVDDTSYDLNAPLKAAITNYRSSLVGFFGDDFDGNGSGGNGNGDGDDDGGITPPVDNGDYECTFSSDKKPSNSFYTIVGNYSNSKGTATVNGVTYDWCLKMESSTSITFTIKEAMTLYMVVASNTTPNVKINGDKVTSEDDNTISYKLEAGTHVVTKADTHNLFYINLIGQSTGIEDLFGDDNQEDGPIYDLSGRPIMTSLTSYSLMV